ncbi:Ig-like domain-containing protein [Sulfurimonas sp.]|uniref:Ig-like domain-containing protein n=1 Tax=Sulfurimonas sp. TaxID=2022749 RepID=UPI002B48779F|nr:Ig-like domain-containing protein [Sulfurimonas sp.]
MLNIITKLMFLCMLSLTLNANNHTTLLIPQKDATNVKSDVQIQITFNNPIIISSTNENTIKLTTGNKNLKGKLSIKDKNTLLFTPNENLKTGIYSLHVKSLKLKNPKPIKLNNWFQKFILKICSFFNRDVKKCKLYNFFFGNNDIITTSINYSFSVNDNIVFIKFISLETIETELKENTQAALIIQAAYSDDTIKYITKNIQWIIQDNSIVTINNTTLETLKEGTTTIQAKIDNTTSNKLRITVYKDINGYILPPEPDETLNNSTLLGIDSNNNGVRDDVERWIYKTYKDKHPIYIDIAMQAGRAYKQVLETPERAVEIHETVVNAPLYCAWYYQNDSEEFGDPLLVDERIDAPVKSKYFNTKERNAVYWEYDTLLSGGSYPLPKAQERKSFCDFNTSKYDK